MTESDESGDSGAPTDSHESGRGDVHRTTHDWGSSEPLHLTVVHTVGAVTDTAPEDLPPLYDSIDPDSLERLLESTATTGRGGVSVEFPYADCRVSIGGTGEVTVQHEVRATADDD